MPWATLVLFCLLAGIGMVGLTTLVAVNERQGAIDRVKASNLILALLIAERLSALFQDGEAVSAHIVKTAALNTTASGKVARFESKNLISRFPELDCALLTDRRGDMVWNTTDQTTHVNVADRAYFKAHEGGAEFLIGDPIIGRVTGLSLLPITRAVRDGDGGFAGVLFIGVKTDVIDGFLGKYAPQAGVIAALWRNDGTMERWNDADEVPRGIGRAEPCQCSAVPASGRRAKRGLYRRFRHRRRRPNLRLCRRRKIPVGGRRSRSPECGDWSA